MAKWAALTHSLAGGLLTGGLCWACTRKCTISGSAAVGLSACQKKSGSCQDRDSGSFRSLEIRKHNARTTRFRKLEVVVRKPGQWPEDPTKMIWYFLYHKLSD